MSSAKLRAEIWMSPFFAPRLDLFKLSRRSLIKMLKMIGPSLLPYRTPRLIVNVGDKNPSISTCTKFEENRFLMTLNIFPLTPDLKILENSRERTTVSKAF